MHKKIIVLSILAVIITNCYSQRVEETDVPVHKKGFEELFDSLNNYRDQHFKAISILEDGLEKFNSGFEEYIIINNLAYLYTLTENYDKTLDLWEKANKKGLFFEFTTEPYTEPEYLEAYLDNDRFRNVLTINNLIKDEANKNSSVEYFVQLPYKYSKEKAYPLIIVLHGGVGNYYGTYGNWNNDYLRANCITVFPQGREKAGSYDCRFGESGTEDILWVYSQVVNKYSVDTSKVIISGQSMGGYLSLQIALKYEIQVAGVILAFPVKPDEFTLKTAGNLVENDIRVVMICGEKDDWFIEGQKKLEEIFNAANIKHDTTFYPDLGHYFPEDFKSKLGTFITFILE